MRLHLKEKKELKKNLIIFKVKTIMMSVKFFEKKNNSQKTNTSQNKTAKHPMFGID